MTFPQPASNRRLRRALLASGLLAAVPAVVAAPKPRVLTVAAFPLVDKIVEAAQPRWRARHPDVELRVISRQYIDHHTAMTTALSTSARLPDVMALEVSFVGRFAQGHGLDDLGVVGVAAVRSVDRQAEAVGIAGFGQQAARRLGHHARLRAGDLHVGPMTIKFSGQRVGRMVDRSSEDIVVTLWRPHWAYTAFPIKDLEDPQGKLGDFDGLGHGCNPRLKRADA